MVPLRSFLLFKCPQLLANATQNWTQLDGCGAWFGTELDAVLKSPHKSLLVETGAGAGAEVETGAGESKSNRISESLPPWLDFGIGGGVTWLLMATEEDGGGIVTLPPGGGGSKLRPPVPEVRGLEAPPFLVVMFPILNLMVCPSLKPKSNLGRLSISWDSLEISVSCFTHRYHPGS